MDKVYLSTLCETHTDTEIVKTTGLSKTTIRYWKKKYGLLSLSQTRASPGSGRSLTCSMCRQTKTVNDYFSKDGRRSSSYCKPCHGIWTRDRYRKFKLQCLEYFGRSSCQICGYDKYIGSLDFHHIDDMSKDFAISDRRKMAFDDTIRDELDKCALLCSNCHGEVHGGLVNVEGLAPPVGYSPSD